MHDQMTKSIAPSRLRLAIMSVFALMLSFSIAGAQDFTDKKINSVQVLYKGAKTVDEARIRNLMSVKAGQKFSAEKLDDDIRSLVESGLVDDVKMSGEERGLGMTLIVQVVTRPALAGVGFAGNVNFTDKKLAKEIKLKPGASLSDATIYEARKNVEKYYLGYGYPDVVVSHRIQSTNREGYSDLILTIEEGVQTEVHTIKFRGNTAFKSHVLKGEMLTKEKGLLSFLTKSGRIDITKLAEDEDRVLDYYRNRGYLRVASNGFRRETDPKGKVSLVMDINEGIKYSVAQIAFAGPMKVFSSAELSPVLTLNTADGFSSKKMRKDIRTIRSYYGSRGYADARVDPDINDAGPGKINITYRITEGDPYKVGRVTIEGNNKTKDRVIRREVPLKPGDNFNSVDVETTRQRLQGLNYFSNVVTEGSPSAQDGYRDINIIVDEKNTGQLSFGLGFSSIDSIVGYINVEETNFDISNPWGFRGGGQRFGLNLRAGSETQDFKISLTEPWFLGQRLSLGTELFYRGAQNLSDYYDQRNVGGAIFLRKPLGKRSYINVDLRYEKIKVEVEDDVPTDSLFQEVGGDFTRPALGLNYVYDSRNSLQTPRRGHKLDTGVTTILESLGGNSDSFIFNVSGSKYWNLWFDSILEFSGSVDMVETASGPTPIYDRQFLGGARNLRGFEYRDVGPRDPETGGVIGGNSAGYATVEWSFPLVSTVRGAFFYDAGVVNLDSWDLGLSDYHSDAGFGLRMNLPFGPIALDYGIPLRSPDPVADKGGQFNFYVDYEF
ncbi:MAG: outer membrane protein assembly factor BamA [Rubritalea sp.]|uniref:outer membrane protein assembly factor BamA n=1 Tax=Rubritalea sp. TaxID=2109375 RepID=UPI0032423676